MKPLAFQIFCSNEWVSGRIKFDGPYDFFKTRGYSESTKPIDRYKGRLELRKHTETAVVFNRLAGQSCVCEDLLFYFEHNGNVLVTEFTGEREARHNRGDYNEPTAFAWTQEQVIAHSDGIDSPRGFLKHWCNGTTKVKGQYGGDLDLSLRKGPKIRLKIR